MNLTPLRYSYEFFSSALGKYPCRTCEATFDRLINVQWLDGSNGVKPSMGFDDIEAYISNLLEDERKIIMF